ncbi:MAG: indole-3-glycerol-phosphate synthase [Brevinematia bacterium]
MNIIEKIIEEKKKNISELKKLHGERIFSTKKSELSFYENLRKSEYLSVIAEIKPKSPSHGEMLNETEIESIINLYKKFDVNAISVLTDEKFFGGSFDLLSKVADMTQIPVLAKDFIIDKIQIDMAVLSGASAVLLISDILDDKKLEELYEYTISKKIDVLVEAHSVENIKRAIQLNPSIIGINNRNLFTLEEDLNHSIKVREFLPDDILKIALSSVKSREDAIKMAEAGYDGILIGSVIMKAFNKSAALNSFKKIEKTKVLV